MVYLLIYGILFYHRLLVNSQRVLTVYLHEIRRKLREVQLNKLVMLCRSVPLRNMPFMYFTHYIPIMIWQILLQNVRTEVVDFYYYNIL